jgi:hypothetical protein
MKRSLLSFVAVLALASTQLSAVDVSVSGFANVVGGINDVSDSDLANGGRPDLINGYTDKYDFQQDSLAAVQFNAKVADNMGAVIQLVAQKSDIGDDIRMEWGYVYWDVMDDMRILAGRVRPALFLYSNYLDVGYAYTWITPPSEVYYQAQITNLDGGNISYNIELDDSTISISAYGGNSSGAKVNPSNANPNMPHILEFEYDSVFGAELAYENDFMKLRAGYTTAKVTNTNFTPPLAALAFDDSSAAFYGAGVSVDYEGFLFAAEYVVRDMDETVAPDVQSYYAMLGYKIGDFTPNYTYSVADSDMEFENTGAPTDARVNGARAMQLDDRETHTLGLRYDVNDAAALKFEYAHQTKTNSEYPIGASFSENDQDINTYRIALNVVF